MPIAADGVTFDAAISEVIRALRGYAADWQERLAEATNHRDDWGLVQLIALSDDDQLRAWLFRVVGSRVHGFLIWWIALVTG